MKEVGLAEFKEFLNRYQPHLTNFNISPESGTYGYTILGDIVAEHSYIGGWSWGTTKHTYKVKEINYD